VRVPKIFEVEKYKTLHQMTSTIEAKLKANLSLENIFSSIFPSGSVTGAPKIKTMEIINSLERSRAVFILVQSAISLLIEMSVLM